MIEIVTGLIAVLAILTVLWVQANARKEVEAAMATWHQRAMSRAFCSEPCEHAIHKLESEIHAGLWYSLFRRISGLAPLLGVMLTAVFLWVSKDGGSGASDVGGTAGSDALAALRPVFGGVLMGALISVVNQLLVVRFEAELQAQLHYRIGAVPSEYFAGIRDVLGTLPAELRQVVETLQQSQRSLFEMQKNTTEEMGKVLTRVRDEMGQLADSATASGKKLRESAAEHFDQVKITTKEFGKTINRLADIVGQSNAHLGGALTAATDQLSEAQVALAKSMESIQVSIGGAVKKLDKQAETVQRGTDEALAAVRKAVDDAMHLHHASLASLLKERGEASDRVLGEAQKVMQAAVASSGQAIKRAVSDLSETTGGLVGLSTSFTGLEKRIEQTAAGAAAGASAATELGSGLSKLDSSVRSAATSMSTVADTVVSSNAELVKRLEQTEGRLEVMVSKLSDTLRFVETNFGGLSEATKALSAQNRTLSGRVEDAATKLSELQKAVRESEKSWVRTIFGVR